ncbi:uncharacterized protein BYT42DRAFT_554548 [Radiomyces spectabilis]|uniref:uncharacterized protein n=1 Tax=Radiomyces spectabilis TaxID=64574 RepID=UPI00221FCB38|nr:uncharacterized protein BYT42DRAFT_554548 [Radiomyces spectabilis]KAI8390852.1 hypothetical protein BYT42DRAFT_554548 [Radiomyces spectabilis]
MENICLLCLFASHIHVNFFPQRHFHPLIPLSYPFRKLWENQALPLLQYPVIHFWSRDPIRSYVSQRWRLHSFVLIYRPQRYLRMVIARTSLSCQLYQIFCYHTALCPTNFRIYKKKETFLLTNLTGSVHSRAGRHCIQQKLQQKFDRLVIVGANNMIIARGI